MSGLSGVFSGADLSPAIFSMGKPKENTADFLSLPHDLIHPQTLSWHMENASLLKHFLTNRGREMVLKNYTKVAKGC